MHLSKRSLLAALSATALTASAGTAVSALADHGEDDGSHHGGLVQTGLAPAVPTDAQLNGVAPGGLPWVQQHGAARLGRNGILRVKVAGLVIPVAPANGTPGPVTTVTASLHCDGASTPVGTTPPAPISRDGDAVMQGIVDVPAKCLAPLVLVHPNGNAAAYIAASGFGD